VACIQPRLPIRGAFDFSAFARRDFQRRCQPQLLVLIRRFHETVALDAVRFRSYTSRNVGFKCPTTILCETRGLQLSWVIRGGIGLTRRLGARRQHTERLNEFMDTHPRTRASYEPIGHHQGMKPGRSPGFCEMLKRLAFSVDVRRSEARRSFIMHRPRKRRTEGACLRSRFPRKFCLQQLSTSS
jgi:hypothetical protein